MQRESIMKNRLYVISLFIVLRAIAIPQRSPTVIMAILNEKTSNILEDGDFWLFAGKERLQLQTKDEITIYRNYHDASVD
jgi:hypothetical protein